MSRVRKTTQETKESRRGLEGSPKDMAIEVALAAYGKGFMDVMSSHGEWLELTGIESVAVMGK